MKQSESFSNSSRTDQVHLAERELSAFIAAVAELFGADQASVSAQDWLDESELMDISPRSTHRNWRTITIAASVRLAKRTALDASTTSTQVSPIPSSNCPDYTDDHIIFEEVRENSIR